MNFIGKVLCSKVVRLVKEQSVVSVFSVFIFVAALLVLYSPSVIWFAGGLMESYSILNLFLLGLVLFFLFKRLRKVSSLQVYQSMQFRWWPFVLIIALSFFYTITELYIKINMLSCAIFFMTLYGLTGFFAEKYNWRKGILPTLLIIQTLPIGPHLDIYFGFPLRLHAAETVSSFLSWFDINEISKETIITIENRSAEVSAACSGLNGLWTSWLFFFTISWIEDRKLNLVWVGYFILLNLFVYSFNLIRIIIIVFLELVLNRPVIAEIVHVPLGIIGFVFSCIIIWFLLHNYSRSNNSIVTEEGPLVNMEKPSVNLMLISASFFLLLLSCALTFKKGDNHVKTLNIHWVEPIATREIPVSKAEQYAFERDRSSGKKYEFSLKNLSGTCLIVYSDNWRGHHPPDLCTQANGFSILKSETKLIEPEFPVTILHLKNSNQKACYWFQSPKCITHDHASRVWSSFKSDNTNWIMVSLLFDRDPEESPEVYKEFIIHVNLMIKQFFNNQS